MCLRAPIRAGLSVHDHDLEDSAEFKFPLLPLRLRLGSRTVCVVVSLCKRTYEMSLNTSQQQAVSLDTTGLERQR